MTEAESSAVIERAAGLLEERYVFPDLGQRMADSLRHDEREGAFAGIGDPEALAEALSGRIRSLSGDGHLWVIVHLEPPEEATAQPTPDGVPNHLLRANFGFPRMEVLPGNVGYLDIRQFVAPALGGATAASAMAFLSHTDAVLLDLRQSMGGSQGMVTLLASYFFQEGEPVHLFDSYHRPSDRTVQNWTLNYLPVPRLAGQPVFILTAPGTFSAGEGLAYLLQQLERATVVGEVTGGGANPGTYHRLNDRFLMFVAESRVTSPVTGENWEGTGVHPDVAVPAAAALEHAHRLALERIRESEDDEGRRQELGDLIEAIRPDGGSR